MQADIAETITMAKRRDIEAFVFKEARLLDERAYERWVELFAEDGIYWVPSGKPGDADKSVALIYDTVSRLKERLIRMKAPSFWAQTPPTETNRLIGNIVISDGADGAISVHYKFIMTTLRRGISALLSGSVEMRLNQRNDDYVLTKKLVRLQQRDLPFANLTFLL
jgi:3-phenylpropionate/cinnamic acid dioxygenase small subunit